MSRNRRAESDRAVLPGLARGGRASALLLGLWLGAPTATGVELGNPPHVSNWQLADGLPQVSVQALAQTPDGYLWLGTQAGLVRFDGIRFELFDQRASTRRPSPGVWSLHVDGGGTLWIGTNTGGLERYADGRFSRVELPKRGRSPNGVRVPKRGQSAFRITRETAPTSAGVASRCTWLVIST
jgi:hypothetical protein